jgi:hypothetical protein
VLDKPAVAAIFAGERFKEVGRHHRTLSGVAA